MRCIDPEIVVIEDDKVDAESVRRTLAAQGYAQSIVVYRDGVEALRGLRSTECVDGKPWLLLLDLNMPRMSGLEFLAELRVDPKLRDCVVFVLSTSDDPRDRAAALALGAAGYYLKSRFGREFIDVNQLLATYQSLTGDPGRPQA